MTYNRAMPRSLRVLALLLLAACASSARKPAANARLVAVLPLSNESLDVEAPAKVRKVLVQAMKDKGFNVYDTDALDKTLREKYGVTDGGQLRVVTADKLHWEIPAELFCYGAIKDYGFKSAVGVSQRKVELALRVADASGKIVYEGDETGVTTKAGVDAAGDLVLDTVGKVVRSVTGKSPADAVADVDLNQETRDAVNKLLSKFPR